MYLRSKVKFIILPSLSPEKQNYTILMHLVVAVWYSIPPTPNHSQGSRGFRRARGTHTGFPGKGGVWRRPGVGRTGDTSDVGMLVMFICRMTPMSGVSRGRKCHGGYHSAADGSGVVDIKLPTCRGRSTTDLHIETLIFCLINLRSLSRTDEIAANPTSSLHMFGLHSEKSRL